MLATLGKRVGVQALDFEYPAFLVKGQTMDDCRNCGNPRRPRSPGAHGYCDTCYRRWAKAGKPASGPPDPKHNLAARMEDLGFLLSVGVKDNDELARRLRIRVETVRKYRKILEDETTGR